MATAKFSGTIRRTTIILALLALGTTAAVAHPDIMISARLLFEFRDGQLAAIGESWAFDTAYSARLLRRFDRDGDRRLSGEEGKAAAASIAGDLKHLGYLTEWQIDDAIQPPLSAGAFDAQVEADTVILTFALRPAQPIAMRPARTILFKILDRDYTAAIRLAEDRPVLLRGDSHDRCKVTIADRPQDAYFGKLVVPQAVTLTCG